MINILICDDNHTFVNAFCDFLTKESQKRKVAFSVSTAESQAELVAVLEKSGKSTDIIFMDIDFGSADGVELTKKINADFPLIKIIYVTAYTEYASRIYNSKFANFVTKPLSAEKISATLDNVLGEIEASRANVIALPVSNKLITIRPDELCFVESVKRKVVLHFLDRNEELYCKTAELEKGLGTDFICCHRSYIVNMKYIKNLTLTSIELNNVTIPVARGRAAEVKAAYLRYISKI